VNKSYILVPPRAERIGSGTREKWLKIKREEFKTTETNREQGEKSPKN